MTELTMEDEERLKLIKHSACRGNYEPNNADVLFLLELLNTEKEHSVFLESLLETFFGDEYKSLTIFKAQEQRKNSNYLANRLSGAIEIIDGLTTVAEILIKEKMIIAPMSLNGWCLKSRDFLNKLKED